MFIYNSLKMLGNQEGQKKIARRLRVKTVEGLLDKLNCFTLSQFTVLPVLSEEIYDNSLN